MNTLAALAGALVASSWQVLVPALVYAALRLLLRGARERYVAALVTLSLQVLWPVVTFVELHALIGVRVNATAASQSQWWLLVPLVWALGAAAMLARLVGGLLVVRRWVRAAGRLDAALVERFEALRVKLGVRPVTLGVVEHLDVPLTVGFWRPVVLVPASLLTALPVESLELLVAHELVHVGRWDALVNAAQMVVEALLFFHPAMWWVSRCARFEREYRCDDEVVQNLGGSARPYAEALLALEQTRQPATAMAVASTGGAFMNRIRRLVSGRSSRSVWPFVVALVVLVGGGTAVAYTVRSEATPVLAVSPELRPVLRNLCQSIRADPCRPEVVQLHASPEDLMTIVMGDLGEQSPAFEQFLVAVSKLPAPQRRDAITRTVSEVTGGPWQCPEFDALWGGGRVDWCAQ